MHQLHLQTLLPVLSCLQACNTLAQCGKLFLQLPGVSATLLLVQALLAEDSSSADLLFDTGREAEAWKVGACLPAWPPAACAHACSSH